ncbi:hypothetical protein ACFLSH_00480 [Bacteroidota bacterium]
MKKYIQIKSENLITIKVNLKVVWLLSKIVDFSPKSGAFITTRDIIRHASEDFCKLFNRKPEDLNGLNFADILLLGLLIEF